MVNEVTAVKLRQNLGELLNQVQYGNHSFVVKKDGKPVAAIVDAKLFERIRSMRERFDELTNKIAEDFRDIPMGEGMAEIDAAFAHERGK